MNRMLVVASLLLSTMAWADTPGAEPLRQKLWAWGNPEMGHPGAHTAASYAQATPMQRARILGVPNVVMAGLGLPASDEAAERDMAAVSSAQRVVWEISPDLVNGQASFDFSTKVARAKSLAARYPQIAGVLLDDMSTVQIDAGLKPEHVRAVREQLEAEGGQLPLWGVVYTMNLQNPDLAAYVRELDVIHLWTWHARDLPDLEKNVAYCSEQWPDKPIVLGLYLHDYGGGGPMPADLLRLQSETALDLAREGRIQGVVFLTIDNEPEAVAWTSQWIREKAGATPGERVLRLGDDWSFSGENWTEDSDGVIRPPDQRNLHSRAFYTKEQYGEVTVEFDYNGSYRETGTGNAGLILRARDPNHFYYLHFPWGGQQLRAKHFWAGLAKVDGDAYQRNLAFEYVPGVPSETDRWYHVQVEAKGPRIRVWVDGREALDLTDDTFSSGHLGLAGYGWYAFRNIRVFGTPSPAAEWNPAPLPTHSFTVGLDSLAMPSGCIAPNGEVLLAQASRLVRSRDKGRTWSPAETLPESLGPVSDYGSALFRAGDKLHVMVYRPQEAVKKSVPEIALSTSTDNGVTWSEPVPSQVASEWPTVPKNLVPYGPVLVTQNGHWLRFLLGSAAEGNTLFTNVITWGTTHAKAYVIRSGDQGASWTAPVDIDWPSWTNVQRGTVPGSLDLTEPSAVAMGNAILVLVRPIYSETMWQCSSDDAGATWDAASRTTFPGYAQSIARTKSGAIVCAHRYPQYSINVSRDGGLNWDAGTVIDYPVWGMGCMLEVEPDVLLCTYMNAETTQPLLAQLVRVTPEGIAPITDSH